MKQTDDYEEGVILLKNKSEAAKLWENESNAYNAMMDYLESKGLNGEDLIDFIELLRVYISKSSYI